MKKFIIKRLVQLIPIIIGITLLSFLLVNVSNTDAIDMLEANRGTAISEEQKNELREELCALPISASHCQICCVA